MKLAGYLYPKIALFAVFQGLLILCASPLAKAQTVTFDLSTDTAFSTTISAINAGDLPPENVPTGAFLIDILTVNGVPAPFSSIGFCTEFEEFVVAGNNTNYTYDSLEAISSGRAGEAGTSSTGIPFGGIGSDRAGQVRYLFDQHYEGTSIDDWTRTTATPDTVAFQLALWEITHDNDFDLDPTDGFFWVDESLNTATQSANSLTLAQNWLDEINKMGIGGSYQSQVWEVNALEQLGSPGDQDLLYASPLPPPVPEPSITLFLTCAFGLVARRHRP